jgi:hypothetical protein
MITTTRMKSQDGRYELSKCVDNNHDYDGGTWYHVWDNVDETIIYEDDSFNKTKELFETLVTPPPPADNNKKVR